jgi:uncharacterized protein YegP (UPF0339 family)
MPITLERAVNKEFYFLITSGKNGKTLSKPTETYKTRAGAINGLNATFDEMCACLNDKEQLEIIDKTKG